MNTLSSSAYRACLFVFSFFRFTYEKEKKKTYSIMRIGGGVSVECWSVLLFPMFCNKATTFSRLNGVSVKRWRRREGVLCVVI